MTSRAGSAHHRRVGDVEGRPERGVDEVDDRAAVTAEDPVGEIPAGATHHQADRDRTEQVCGPAAGEPDDESLMTQSARRTIGAARSR